MASIKWVSGCEPVPINPLSASFVAFFPVRDSTTQAPLASEGSGVYTASDDVSWADKLAAYRPTTRHPAWSRVAVQAHPATLRKGLIMKRVGLSSLHHASAPKCSKNASDAAPEGPEATETVRNVRPRLASFKTSEQELELDGSPISKAETVNSIMQAKVDVTNCLLAHDVAELSNELRQSKTSKYTKNMVPTKRRFTDYSFIDSEYASGGNGVKIHADLNVILEKAAQIGANKVDIHMASIAEACAKLQNTRPDPRVYLAASGQPDLSDITDLPELDSALALTKPSPSGADAKSPTKKVTPLSSSPIKGSSSRLSETIVRLLPASSPRAEPSPTKSSAPSTPFKDSPRASQVGDTPSIPKKSPCSSGKKTPGFVRAIQRLFREPPSPSPQPVEQSSSEQDTPTRLTCPAAPTPPRWNRPERNTPHQMVTPKTQMPTLSQIESPLRRVASIQASLKSTPSPVKLLLGDPTTIDFGSISPSFGRSSWLHSPVSASEHQRTKNLRRRTSEPLIRKTLMAQSRQKSLSPQKMSTKRDGDLVESSPSLPSASVQRSVVTESSRSNKFGSDVMLEDCTGASTYVRYVNNVRATATDSPTPSSCVSGGSHASKGNEILDIDMRQNPDIFGAQVSAGSASPAIKQLARMAENRCDGNANVVVTEEDGRLVVRFKLPTEYAPLFPESQGLDESHFTMSPSVVSSTPRLRFRSHPVPAKYLRQSAILEDHEPGCTLLPDNTLVVSDFGGSPVKATNLSAVTGLSPLQGKDGKSLVEAPDLCEDTTRMSFPSFAMANDDTTVLGLGGSPSTHLLNTPARSNSSSTPSKPAYAPSFDNSKSLGITDIPLPSDTEISTPAQAFNVEATTPSNKAATVSANVSSASSPTAAASFTPANQIAAGSKTPASNSALASEPNSNHAFENDTQRSDASALNRAEDSPGCEYMRGFIKRSKPKRLATDSGSPIAPPQRLPLGIKSPNTESPLKGKRKFESIGEENESKKQTEPSPKRVRRVRKASPQKAGVDDRSEAMKALTMAADDSTEGDESADAQEDGAESDDAPVARRSSRLRSKGPKSSIPTAIKVRRGHNALNTMRSVQQELSHQTRTNTRKNKGGAEYPAQVLARSSEEVQEDIPEQPEMVLARTRSGRVVGWKEPLVAYREGKPKKGKEALPKTKAKPEDNCIAKVAPKVTSTMQRQRSTRVAASLDMAGNGTPTKRVTRSSARTLK